MKKTLAILLILIFTKMGVSYADTTEPLTIRNFFLGSSPSADANLNQVLALLVGPQGVPGPAGVAGRDGFIGMNGQDGRDGLDGAPGIVGPQGLPGLQGATGAPGAQGPPGARGATGADGAPGANGTNGTSTLAIVIAVGSPECSGRGGTKFVTGGLTTFACNGAAGTGSGGSGGTTFTFGQGRVEIGTCDSDATVGFTFPTRWSGTDFFLNQVSVSGVDGRCIGADLKIYFQIKSTGPIYVPSSNYALGDNLVCTHPLTASEPGLAANPSTVTTNVFSLLATATCTRTSAGGATRPSILLGDIGTRDLSDWVGFEIL
jgi:hypothetical protein